MTKILQLILIAGFWCSSAYGFLDIKDFRQYILPKCYDYKDEKELINGQISPIPSSIEAFISLVERLEENYSMERILRSLIARFRYDDLLLKYMPTDELEFFTRGGENVKKAHEILQDLFGGSMTSELKESDLSEDEQCALYFMISHTVNDTVTPFQKQDEPQETVIDGRETLLKYPREQGVVNLNTKTLHAFALGKVLLGILAGLQDSPEKSAEAIFRKKMGDPKTVPNFLKDVKINVLYGVTISDIIAITFMDTRSKGKNEGKIFLPNGHWDDSVCPTRYILDDNNFYYTTTSLIRGAMDGIILGLNIKDLRSTYKDIQLSQILRMYYNPAMVTPGSALSEISWCMRHSQFALKKNDIIDSAASYFQLYASLLELNEPSDLRGQLTQVVDAFSSNTQSIFDDAHTESGACGGISGVKPCETPRGMAAILDMKSTSRSFQELQFQIIGNLSVGFHMSPSSSSMAVYTNLRSNTNKLHSINASDISGCPSCAAKYYGYFETVPTTTVNEVEVFRDLNRTITRDDFPDESASEPGVPAKVVLYFNYGSPTENNDLRRAVSDFRYQHRGTKVYAIGTNKDALKPFVNRADNDIFTQDIRTLLPSLKDRVCRVPAQFQFEKCYTNSRSEEDASVYHGHITPNHVQYWAMYPKYFLKSFNIRMSFTTASGQIKVCFTRSYEDIFISRQPTSNCKTVDGDKVATFDVKDPCKKFDVNTCNPFYFYIEALNVPEKTCTDKMCRAPTQIEFEFKHSGISCNQGISFTATPMTLAVAFFMSIWFALKH